MVLTLGGVSRLPPERVAERAGLAGAPGAILPAFA